MIALYQRLMTAAEPLLNTLLDKRLKAGKEDSERLNERKGQAGRQRPDGLLYWVHAASVGEAQSALILIRHLIDHAPDAHVLVTTGTKTSASMMEKSLPERAFHQYYPLDHPEWVTSFLDHWSPDFIAWMESELWPNMLLNIQKRNIPAALINARLSPASFGKWRLFKPFAQTLLKTFSTILCQTEQDASFFNKLGANSTYVTDNLKYSAQALKVDDEALKLIYGALQNRPCWVYASTHQGEEALAARIHERLKASYPDLLTILIPRHPERRDTIKQTLSSFSLETVFRGEEKTLPELDTDIYVADTLGELGLFYRAAPIACIGRSFSDDGGGGHNPIEAAQLHCAVLHGPNVQNLQVIFDEMNRDGAALMVADRGALFDTLHQLLEDTKVLETKQERAYNFAYTKTQVIERVMEQLSPILPTLPPALKETGS